MTQASSTHTNELHVVNHDPFPLMYFCHLCLGLSGRLGGLSLGRVGRRLSSGGCLGGRLGLRRCPEGLVKHVRSIS
jgi:hypothetical protein